MKEPLAIALSILAASFVGGCYQGGDATSQRFTDLPPVVQKTVRAEAPQAEIDHISRLKRGGREIYEITFSELGVKPEVVVAADGTLIKSDFPKLAASFPHGLTPTGLPGTPFNALPGAVQRAIQTRAPGADIDRIDRLSRKGQVIYEVHFKDAQTNPPLLVTDQGLPIPDPGKDR